MQESYLSSPVSEPEKTKDIPLPIQLDKSVGGYFKQIKLSLGLGMDDEKIKENFINDLSPENQINVIRFGIKEPINNIIEHLNFISTGPTDIQKFRFGELKQGNESVMEYFAKVEKCGKLAGYNEERLRYFFLCGLSRDNQLEVRRCGTDMSLDELVAKLSVVENIPKMHSIYA